MGNFGKAFTRELGKNTGKWVSNKVFGDGHATPYKLKVERIKAEKKAEEIEVFVGGNVVMVAQGKFL